MGRGKGFGYDITEIQSIAAWNAGFANQKYDVSVKYIDDDVFTFLLTVDYQPFSTSVFEGGSSKVNITSKTGILASGIQSIKFTIYDSALDHTGSTVFREIDINGFPSDN